MNKKNTNPRVLAIAIIFFLFGCNNAPIYEPTKSPPFTASQTLRPTTTSISSATVTKSPTSVATVTKSPTSVATVTKSPTSVATVPQTAPNYFELRPRIGSSLSEWGAPGVTIVWAGTATYPTNCTDSSTDVPMDYYCGKEPSRRNDFWGNWGNDSLRVVGVIQDGGTTTIRWDKPERDIVLVWGKPTYVDSIEAILEDGTLIPFGYAPDSKGVLEYQGNRFSPVVPFAESDGRWNYEIEMHGWNSHAFDMNTYDPQPCGFMGLGPDNNLILIPSSQDGWKSEGLLGLFPRYSYRNLEYGVYKRGLNAYAIIGVIITQYDKPPTGSKICDISLNKDPIFETLDWETPDTSIPDRYNNAQVPPNMDFDEVDFYYEEFGLYIRIKAKEPFYLGQSEIDIRFTESGGLVYGLSIHPSSEINPWNCMECTGDWIHPDEIKASWGDVVVIYVPWESIGNKFEVNQLWMSLKLSG